MKRQINIKIFDSLDTNQSQPTTLHKSKYHQSRSPICRSTNINSFLGGFEYCQTPKQRNKSPSFEFKSSKYKGIIQKKILQRLQYYKKQNQTKKNCMQVIYKSIQQEKEMKQIKSKPQINEISKILYKKMKKERNLSPNILERFQTYEVNKANKQAQYQLLRTCSFTVENDVMMCKNVLQEKNMNNSKSKSCKLLNSIKQKSSANNVENLIKTTKKMDKSPRKVGIIKSPEIQTILQGSKQKTFKFNTMVQYSKHCSPFHKKAINPNKWHVKRI